MYEQNGPICTKHNTGLLKHELWLCKSQTLSWCGSWKQAKHIPGGDGQTHLLS